MYLIKLIISEKSKIRLAIKSSIVRLSTRKQTYRNITKSGQNKNSNRKTQMKAL
jgi:hypothetical protein